MGLRNRQPRDMPWTPAELEGWAPKAWPSSLSLRCAYLAISLHSSPAGLLRSWLSWMKSGGQVTSPLSSHCRAAPARLAAVAVLEGKMLQPKACEGAPGLLHSGLACEKLSAARRAVPPAPGTWARMATGTGSHRRGLPSGTHRIPLIPHLITAVNWFKLATNQYTGAKPKTTGSKQQGQPRRSQYGCVLPRPAAHLGQGPGDPPAFCR